MSRSEYLLLILVAICLPGCKEDHAPSAPPYMCAAIADSNPTTTTAVDSNCTECSIAEANSAADGVLNTSAAIMVASLAGNDSVVLTVQAPPGTVYPETFTPGYQVSASSGETCVEIRTYLNGTRNDGTSTLCGLTTSGDEIGTALVGVSHPFDAVELAVGSYGAAGSLRIHEVCVNE